MEPQTAIPEPDDQATRDAVAPRQAPGPGALPVQPQASSPAPAQGQPAPQGQALPAAAAPQRSYSDIRSSFLRAAAMSGDPSVFTNAVTMWNEAEHKKVQGHMQGALMAAAQGDNGTAAKQLELAGTYLWPGVVGRVSPGPNGAFVVQNSDAATGQAYGGYAVTPQNILEMVNMMSDPMKYQEMVWDQHMDTQEYDLLAQETASRIRENNAQIPLIEQQTRNAVVDEAAKLLDMEVTLAQEERAIAQANADSRAALLGNQKTEMEIAQAQTNYEQGIADRGQEMFTQGWAWAQDANTPENLPMVQDPNTGEMVVSPHPAVKGQAQADPRYQNAMYDYIEETDTFVPNMRTQRTWEQVTRMLTASGLDQPSRIALAVNGMILEAKTDVMFSGTGQQGDPYTVRVNGDIIPLDPSIAPMLERVVLQSRRSAYQANDPARLQNFKERGFSTVDPVELPVRANQTPIDPAPQETPFRTPTAIPEDEGPVESIGRAAESGLMLPGI